MLTSCMYVGGAVSTDLTGRLIGPLGWRGVFFAFTLPGLVWAAWFAVWFRNRPAQHPAVNPAELALLPKPDAAPAKAATPAAPTPWLAIFLSPALVMICVQQFARSGAIRFLDMWLPTYLQEARHQTVAAAGALAKWPQLGAMVGVLLGGALSDAVLARTGSRRAGRNGVAVGCLLVGTACFVAAFFLRDARLAVLALSVGSMVSSSANPCVYSLTMDMGGRNLGVVFATMNMAGNLGSSAFAWCAPLLVGYGGWDAPLAVFAGLHLFAAVCWLFINPNGTIGERPPAALPEQAP
jgi:sugar phosphate permease